MIEQGSRPELVVIGYRNGPSAFVGTPLHDDVAAPSSHLCESIAPKNPTDFPAGEAAKLSRDPPIPNLHLGRWTPDACAAGFARFAGLRPSFTHQQVRSVRCSPGSFASNVHHPDLRRPDR